MAAIAPRAKGNRAAAFKAKAIISGPRIFCAFSVMEFDDRYVVTVTWNLFLWVNVSLCLSLSLSLHSKQSKEF